MRAVADEQGGSMVSFYEANGCCGVAGCEDVCKYAHRLEIKLALLESERPEKISGHQEICGVGISEALRCECTLSPFHAANQLLTAMVLPVPQFMRDRETLS